MAKIFDLDTDQLNYKFEYNKEETDQLFEIAKNLGNRMSEDFVRRIALWKYNRVIHLSDETNQMLEKLRYLKNLSPDSETSKKTILSLTSNKGIGFPLGSAILKFIRPDVFPIIDVRAYRALTGIKLHSYQYNLDIYTDYCEKISILSKSLDLQMMYVDQQLYEFDKDHNGKI